MASRDYLCLELKQRDAADSRMAVFVALAKDVVEWAGVRRVGEHEQGMQRVRKPTRVGAISRFMRLDPSNQLPTSIVVAFEPSAAKFTALDSITTQAVKGDPTNGANGKVRWGRLQFDFDAAAAEHLRPALIVDGQHRLHGLAAVDESIPVLVTALLDASPIEQAFQFIVINNKAARVVVDNVKSIIAEFDEQVLSDRLKRAGISYRDTPGVLYDIDTRDDSPFKALLDWPSNQGGRRLVKPATIESSLRYVKTTFPILQDGDDDDTVREIFLAIWRAVKEFYPDLFPDNQKFMTKVNMMAVHEAVVDRIESAAQDGGLNIYEASDVYKYAKEKVFPAIPKVLWTCDWTIALNDSAPIRAKIKDAIKRVSQNTKLAADRDWFDGVDIVVPP